MLYYKISPGSVWRKSVVKRGSQESWRPVVSQLTSEKVISETTAKTVVSLLSLLENLGHHQIERWEEALKEVSGEELAVVFALLNPSFNEVINGLIRLRSLTDVRQRKNRRKKNLR
jgi:hypothetical protein